MDCIYNRRSCRQYKDEAIDRKEINAIIKAGMNAPSAHNQQPVRYTVIESRDKLSEIAAIHPYAQMLPDAAFGVLIYFDESVLKSPDFVQQDCAAAVENMLTKATDMGIGSVWIGVYPKVSLVEGLQKMLRMGASEVPFALISFGMPMFVKDGHNRFEESWVKYI